MRKKEKEGQKGKRKREGMLLLLLPWEKKVRLFCAKFSGLFLVLLQWSYNSEIPARLGAGIYFVDPKMKDGYFLGSILLLLFYRLRRPEKMGVHFRSSPFQPLRPLFPH